MYDEHYIEKNRNILMIWDCDTENIIVDVEINLGKLIGIL